jgi:hypothetical protein
MRKYLISAAIALVAVGSALARTASISDWMVTEAKRLDTEVGKARLTAAARPTLKPQPLNTTLVTDLERFGSEAGRLSVEIDRKAGAVDLRCIFRGMAEETDTQLKAAANAKTGAEQVAALSRLDHMLTDAALIAPSAGRLLAGDMSVAIPIDAPVTSYAKACPPAIR